MRGGAIPVDSPLVSVIMPVRDGQAHLAEAIASIGAQTLTAHEFLIIDDGSSDATPAILRAAAARDPRIRLLTREGAGIVAALNLGLASARALFVARMDADDMAPPDRLARQVAFLRANPGIGAVGAGHTVIDPRGARLRGVVPPADPGAIRAALLVSNPMAHPTMLLRRETVLAAGGYRDGFPFCEDYDLWLRLSEVTDLANIPEPLLLYREHGGQETWRHLEGRLASEAAVLRAAERRRAGLAEETGTPGPEAIRDRAFLAARGALGEGRPEAAWIALHAARRQGRMSVMMALRWSRLALRAWRMG